MNTRWTPYRSGLQRGWLEFKHMFTSGEDLAGYLIPTGIAVTVIIFLRDVDVAGAPVSLGSMTLPSLLGMNVAFGGLMGVVGMLVTEREDGTLLRAKATPGGMTGYLVGAVVSVSGFVVLGLFLLLGVGMMFFEGVSLDSATSWLLLLSTLLLGLVATMPIGAVLGSLFSSPRSVGLIMLPIMGLVAISGIFYPITALPEWVQWIGQAFPFYWLGLGMRSAMLPDGMAAVEIGESWRHLETVGVLGLWAVVGMLLAPVVLRRMARRESGSAVAARRERAMQTVR